MFTGYVGAGHRLRARVARATRAVAAVVGLALMASMCTEVASVAAEPSYQRLPVQQDRPVPGAVGELLPFPTDPAAARALTGMPAAAVWPTAGSVTVDVPAGVGARPAAARAGSLPITVAPAGGAAAAGAVPSRVRVSVVDVSGTARAGRPEVLLRVARADGGSVAARVSLSVDYRGFRSAFGGDWANRLRLVSLPECALSTPAASGCVGMPVPSRNDAARVTADVAVAPSAVPSAGSQDAAEQGVLFALVASSSGSTGSFAATSLSPSSSWQAGGSSGDFSWSYPLRVSPSLNGPAPEFGLRYSAQSVDGRSAASNNQPSWMGEGFEFWPGYIERGYRSCADDMGSGANNTTKTGDECWGSDNATMSLGGSATELVRDDATGGWRPRSEDGSRVEHLTDTGLGNGDNDGEYWKVTTGNGTQYWFGRHHLPGWVSGKPTTNSTWTMPVFGNHTGEPCHQATFDASWCMQAWRWNLDYVVDPHGNSMSYWYTAEANKYARDLDPAKTTSYTRGGYLTRVDYGTRTTAEFGTAPMRVNFATADRCLSNCATHGANWPDTPWDQDCSATTSCLNGGPTFWTTRRLSKVTTQVWNASTSAYRDVESWTFTHSFPDPGDATRAGLWLASISHSGLVGGTVTVPNVTFTGVQMANRVDTVTDQQPPMNWWRISSVRTETGGEISVAYSGPDCVAGTRMPSADDQNTLRCYPVWYTPDGATSPKKEYFHKYVVSSVSETDHTGGATRVLTSYSYLGSPAWHYTDDNGLVKPSEKTWSVWRGYGRVGVTKGDPGQQSYGETRYFRGMDGDKLTSGTRSVSVADTQGGTWPDTDALAGTPREQISSNGVGGPEVSGLITDPWLSAPTASRTINGSTVVARYLNTGATHQRIALDGGRGYRRITSSNSYDEYGMPVQTNDLGDEATSADDQCVKTTYARNTSAWLMSYTSRVQTYALSCDKTPASSADVIGDGRTSFDGQAWGAAPTKGDVTRVEALSDWTAGTPSYYTVTRSAYDAYGRVTDSWDVDDNHTTSAYTPATGGPVTRTTSTNPLGWVTTTDHEPAWGLEVGETDPNSRRTDLAYDALGRLTSVWLPGRAKATQTPNTTYAYLVRTNGTVAVTTSALGPNGNYVTSYDLFDGLLRPRQTQDPEAGSTGGRIVTDDFYDSAGRAYKSNAAYVANSAPSTDLFTPTGDNVIPSQTLTLFDGADRATASILRSLGVEKWRTTTGYGGDRVDITPPAGGTATSTVTDGRGRATELRQYRGSTPTGAYDATTYTYGRKNVITSVADPVGNTWRYTYDLRGRQTQVDDPDKGAATSTYYNDGSVATTTDSRGQTLAYTYDTLDRRTAEYSGSTTGTKLAEWTYDTLAKGQPVSSTRYLSGNAYTTAVTGYDSNYRPTGTTITVPTVEGSLAGTYRYTSTYKPDGSPSTTTLPAAGGLPQETIGTDYNALGEPLTLTGDTSYVTNSQYTRLGEPAVYTYSVNGPDTGPVAQVGYYYDEATRRLDRQITVRETSPSTIADVHYTYDPAGNLTKVADTPQGGVAETQCFTYDYVRRLTEAWTPGGGDCAVAPSAGALGGPAPYWQSYTYSTVGERTASTDHATPTGDVTTTYTYPAPGAAQPHTLRGTSTKDNTGTKTASYAYDALGDTTSRPGPHGTQTLTWDAEGHLASVADTTGTTTYTYDADGDRLLARDPAGTTLYLPGQEVRLTKATGLVSCTRYYSHGGQAVAQRTTAGVTWLAPDWQGTDQIAINAGGTQQVTQRRQTPFGGPRGTQPTWPNPHGFVDGTNDPTGLTHEGAREYDPSTGRFISVDPVFDSDDPQQMEGYTYSNNNPITFSDPSGLIWMSQDGGYSPPPPDGGTTPASGSGGGDGGGGTPSSGPSPHTPDKPKKCHGWDLGCRAKKAFHATVNWVDDHKAVIAGVAAGIVAGAICEAATAGAGSVGCLAVAGAVSSMVEYTVKTKVEHKGSFSWGGLLVHGAVGAAEGALLGVGGNVVGAGVRTGGSGLFERAATNTAFAAGKGAGRNAAGRTPAQAKALRAGAKALKKMSTGLRKRQGSKAIERSTPSGSTSHTPMTISGKNSREGLGGVSESDWEAHTGTPWEPKPIASMEVGLSKAKAWGMLILRILGFGEKL